MSWKIPIALSLYNKGISNVVYWLQCGQGQGRYYQTGKHAIGCQSWCCERDVTAVLFRQVNNEFST